MKLLVIRRGQVLEPHRVEDRIRAAKDTGLRNLPFHDFDQNRIWLAVVAWQMPDVDPQVVADEDGGHPGAIHTSSR